jgi:hypothetical protein
MGILFPAREQAPVVTPVGRIVPTVLTVEDRIEAMVLGTLALEQAKTRTSDARRARQRQKTVADLLGEDRE